MKTVTKVVSAALLAAAVTVTNAAEITWSGAAQYRARLDWVATTISTPDTDSTSAIDTTVTRFDRSNKYAWKVGMKAAVNENLTFGFQLENPEGYSHTGTVDEGMFDYGFLSVTRAYMGVKKGIFHSNMGIIPLDGNSTLDLAAQLEDGKYRGLHMSNSWGVLRASSLVGAEIGFEFSDALALNIAAATMVEDGFLVVDEEEDSNPKDDMRFCANLPIKIGNVTLTPAVNVISGIADSWTSLSPTGGLDFKWKKSDKFTLKLGAAAGGYGAADQLLGIYGMVKPSWKFNDKFSFAAGASYGNGRLRAYRTDAKDETAYSNIHWDLKFGIKPVKNFTIMPRVRNWLTFNSNEDDDTIVGHTRPELLFIASF